MYSHHIQTQQQYQALKTSYEELKRGQMRIRKRMLHQSKAIQAIDDSQSSLSNRFVQQYGASSNPAPKSTYVDEDFIREEQELRDIEEDDNMEEVEEGNMDNEEENVHDPNQPPNA